MLAWHFVLSLEDFAAGGSFVGTSACYRQDKAAGLQGNEEKITFTLRIESCFFTGKIV